MPPINLIRRVYYLHLTDKKITEAQIRRYGIKIIRASVSFPERGIKRCPQKSLSLLPFFTSNKLVSAEYGAHQTIALFAIKIPANVDM